MSEKFNRFFSHWITVGVAAGLYPILHYYNGNFHIADSWYQFLYFLGICLVMPLVFIGISKLVIRTSNTQSTNSYWLTAINLAVFWGLLSFLIFHFDNWIIALFAAISLVLSLVLRPHVSKIVVLQLLLAAMSLFTMVPKLFFMVNHSNEWANASDHIAEVSFKKTPNIYVIQPDGFTNFSELREAPYDYTDTTFEDFLVERGFVNYTDFRSNYYSTLTSNASLFAMKHHYYSNTYPGNLKTIGAQEVVVGSNSMLEALKKNNYKTHFITDNSFFLTNRKLRGYDFSSVPQSEVLLHDTGGIPGIRTVRVLIDVLDEASPSHNFYFIEKTWPGHIKYSESESEGPEREREKYLQRLKSAENWLTQLVKNIQRLDKNPLIVIVADHGGFVGLNSVTETRRRKLNSEELVSVFSSQLSIHWPEEEIPNDLEFTSNVNVFRNIIAYLSEDKTLLNHMEPDESYLPLYEGSKAKYYRCIDDKGDIQYELVE